VETRLVSRTKSWVRYLALSTTTLLLVTALSSCNSSGSKGPTANARFCNNLTSNSGDFTAYLSLVGEGVNEYWTAYTGACTPCKRVKSGRSLTIEMGDESDWIARGTKTLTTDQQYMFVAEIDSEGDPNWVSYVAKSGYTCEDLGLN
jgi:hypothetical protein